MTAEVLYSLPLEQLLTILRNQVNMVCERTLAKDLRPADLQLAPGWKMLSGPPLMELGDFVIFPRFSADRSQPAPPPSTDPTPSIFGEPVHIGPPPKLEGPGKQAGHGLPLGIERCPHCGHVFTPESPPTLESSPADNCCTVCGVNYAIHGKHCEGY